MSCENCGSTERLVKHHVSYVPEVTMTLCRTCHQIVHQLGNRRTELKACGLFEDPTKEWQFWKGTIYRYNYNYKRSDGSQGCDKPAQVRVPVDIADYLNLKNKDEIFIAIRPITPTETEVEPE